MLGSKALADIQILLAGTCPPPVGEEVTAANVGSRSNTFAAAEGVPHPSDFTQPSKHVAPSRADIKECSAEIVHNASVPILVEAALQRESGSYLTSTGALAVRSGAKTGRSPKDKRIVESVESVDNVWWGPVNIKMEEKSFMLNREYATRPHRPTAAQARAADPRPHPRTL